MNVREWGIALLCTAIPGDELTPLTLAQLRVLGERVRAMGRPEQPLEELRPDDLLKMGTDVGVAWQDGRLFEDPWGIRMNLALPRFKVQEAFERLNRYVFLCE